MTRLRAVAHAAGAAQTGMTLIEVLIAALLVALIATATFSAFDAAGRSTQDTRAHAEAVQLAGQDEERLRGMTTTQLGQLGSTTTKRAGNGDCLEEVSGAWHYWSKGSTSFCENPTGLSGTTYTGTVFTITSSASYVSAEEGSTSSTLTCEKTGGAADYLQTTSSVSWPMLGTRPPVSQSSLVTVPSSAALLVHVYNQSKEGVSGATVTVSGISPELTQTTPASGCVIFGGMSAGTVKVTATKTGLVNEEAEAAPPAKSVSLSSDATAEAPNFMLAEPGGISVEFVEAASPHGAVPGSTFYAFETAIAEPDGFVGGSANTYSTTASIGKILFPFRNLTEKPPGNSPYTVFAGDCEANNAKTVTGESTEIDAKAQVEPNGSGVPVKVELPAVNVTVYEGTEAAKGKLLSSSSVETNVMIINEACKTKTARTGSGTETVPYEHEDHLVEGHLEDKFQPFAAELELCIVMHKGSHYYKYEKTFPNKTKAGYTWPATIYMESATKTSSAASCP